MSYPPEIKVEDYTDPFYLSCHWPTGLKIGDGSVSHCGRRALHRVTFESDGVAMLCSEHKQALMAIRDQRVKDLADEIAQREMFSPSGARPIQ